MKTYRGKPRSWWVARRAEHRALWNWLAKTGFRRKYIWSGWEHFGGKVVDVSGNNCVACDVVSKTHKIYSFSCLNCPIEWAYGVCERNLDSDEVVAYPTEYEEWCGAGDHNRKELAAAIRDLPWYFELAEFTEGG